MIAALLFAASVPTAVDAEFAFARDAQRIGQWTAFRKWADKDAVVFKDAVASFVSLVSFVSLMAKDKEKFVPEITPPVPQKRE